MSGLAIFLFVGDIFVMGFLCFLAAWLLWVAPKEDVEEAMRLPLADDTTAADAAAKKEGEAA